MRAVDRAGRKVEEERLVRVQRPVGADVADGVARQVLGQMIIIRVLRLDGRGVPPQARLVLRGFACDEAIEVVEAQPGRVLVEGAGRRQGRDGRVVPFAEGGRVVAVVAQNARHGGRRARNLADVAVEVVGELGDDARADAVMIASGEQRGPRGRAHRRRVEAIVGDAVLAQPGHGRRMDRPAEGFQVREPGVVGHEDDDVRCIFRNSARRLTPVMLRLLERAADGARRRGWREGKVRAQWFCGHESVPPTPIASKGFPAGDVRQAAAAG